MKIVLLLLIILTSGCREERRSPTTFTEASEQASLSIADTAAIPAPAGPTPDSVPAPPPATATAAVTLSPFLRGTLTGSGSFKVSGNGTMANMTLTARGAGGNYEGVIRIGTCEHLGPSVADLNPVSIDSLGSGRSASIISVPIDSLVQHPHAVVFGKGGRPQVCGAIS